MKLQVVLCYQVSGEASLLSWLNVHHEPSSLSKSAARTTTIWMDKSHYSKENLVLGRGVTDKRVASRLVSNTRNKFTCLIIPEVEHVQRLEHENKQFKYLYYVTITSLVTTCDEQIREQRQHHS